MKIIKSIEIENGVLTCKVTCGELGDSAFTAEEELNILHNYPLLLKFSEVDFAANVKFEEGVPVLSEINPDDLDSTTVDFNNMLVSKAYTIDENLDIEWVIDSKKVVPVGDHVSTARQMSEAMATIFVEKVVEKISEIVAEAKEASNVVEITSEVTV